MTLSERPNPPQSASKSTGLDHEPATTRFRGFVFLFPLDLQLLTHPPPFSRSSAVSLSNEKTNPPVQHHRYHFVERSYGKTSRSVRLPEATDITNANADLNNGVLTITFPKKETPVSSRFRIPLGGGGGGGGSGDGKISIEGGAAATDGDTGS